MSIEDQPTEQIRRVPPAAPMPEPMNPAGPSAEAPPVENPNDGTTDVLSINDLFEAPSTTASPAEGTTPPAPPVAATTQPVSASSSTGSARVGPEAVTPAAAAGGQRRIGAVPAASGRQGSGFTDRLRGDGVAGRPGGVTRSLDWLTAGDNAVIVATACAALLLLLAVALF